MSGIFLTSKNNLQNSLYKKTKGLVYPYILFSVPFFFIICALNIIRGNGLREVSFFNPNSFLLGTEWFLIVLFLSLFIFLFLNEVGNKWIKVIAVFLLFFFCYFSCLLGYSGDGGIHYQIDYLTMAGISLPFLYVGNYYFKITNYLKRHKLVFFLSSLFLIILFGMGKPKVCIPWLIVCPNPFVFLITPIAGFLLFVTMCSYIKDLMTRSQFLNNTLGVFFYALCFWGYYSLFILIMHWLMIKYLFGRCLHLLLVPIGEIESQLYEDFACIILSVVFCCFSAYVGKLLKKIPFFF